MDDRQSPPKLRTLGFLWLIAFLVWIPFEDQNVWSSLLLGGVGSVWFSGKVLLNKRWVRRLGKGMLGLFWGLATVVAAIFLLALKVGLHAHSFSDFTFGQVEAILVSTPIWLVLGFVAALLIFRGRDWRIGERE